MRVAVTVCLLFCLGSAVWPQDAEGKMLTRTEIVQQLEASVFFKNRRYCLSNCTKRVCNTFEFVFLFIECIWILFRTQGSV